jgi:hypothetical protein
MYGAQGLDAVAVVPAHMRAVASSRTSLRINADEAPESPGGELSGQDPETRPGLARAAVEIEVEGC